MEPRGRTTRSHLSAPGAWRRWVGGAVALVVVFAAGCKSKGGGGLFGNRGGDPLLGQGRIPPQGLPVPGRGDTYTNAADGRKDPLLDPGGSPALPTSAPTDRTDSTPKSKNADAAMLPKTPNPYRPDKTTSPAALAPLPTDDRDLSVGRRATDSPIAVSIPAGPTLSQISAILKEYGATFEPPVSRGGQYLFRCDLPVRNGQPGQLRRYEGTGSTPAAAAKQVLDQVNSDYGRR
ncbi:MAG: hypothetical protein ACRC7O_00435 [Fimbriiglobus sp.]